MKHPRLTFGLALAGLAVLLAAGYLVRSRLSAPAPERQEPAEQETAANRSDPPVPDESGPEDAANLESRTLVSERTERERRKKSGYIYDPKLPGGTLKGMCYVKYDKRVRLFPPFPVELEGPNAIRVPRKGERAYYRKRQPMPLVYLDPYAAGEKRYGVRGAVIMIHDVEAGARRNFDRLWFQVDFRNHQILPAKPEGRDVFNPSAYGIGVMRTKHLVQVLNLSLYDADLALTNIRTGKVVWEEVVKAYRDPKFPGEHLGFNPVMERPERLQLPRMNERGIYRLSCRRHPWQRAYLVVWDSPYVTVSTGTDDVGRRPEQSGAFAIGGIPEGRHVVEVWHPEFEPVQDLFEVDVTMDQTTPLTVAFKVPALLTEKPEPLPDKTITDWAFVGPFYPLMDEEPDAPNNRLDFAATYDGMDDEEVAWKRIQVAGSGHSRGYVLLDKIMWRMRTLSLSYYAVKIHSPKAQRLYLGVHNRADALRIWLNGKVSFQSYIGDFGRYARYSGWFVVTGDLRAGENTLLVMVSAENTERSSFSIKYRADGATLKVPAK